MKENYNNQQKKIYSDYYGKSNGELLNILEKKGNYISEVIEIVVDILKERELIDIDFQPYPNDKIDENRTMIKEAHGFDFKENFISPKGRIGRDEFFLRSIGLNLPLILNLISILLFDFNFALNPFIAIAFIILFILNFIQKFKRFHDINKSGWNSIWTYLLPPITWLYLINKRGTEGTNRYGNPPTVNSIFKS